MSAAVTTADLPPQPGPATDRPRRFAPLLCLVRKLIDYGKQLAASLQEPTPTADLDEVAATFGTYDFRQIIAAIIRGLQRATALEARLERLDAHPAPEAEPAAIPSRRQPRAEVSAAPRAPRAAANPALPFTPEQIAAQVRCRPIGAVLADICRDLGILSRHELWQELQSAIIIYDGSLNRLVRDIGHRPLLDRVTHQPMGTLPGDRPLFATAPLLAATGPP